MIFWCVERVSLCESKIDVCAGAEPASQATGPSRLTCCRNGLPCKYIISAECGCEIRMRRMAKEGATGDRKMIWRSA